MKIDFPKQRSHGLTRRDVLVAVLLASLLFVIVVPMLLAARRRNERINCIDNLMQIDGALRIWEDDKGPGMPPVKTNGQTIGLNNGQIALINSLGISNIVHSSKILICPADRETPITTDAAGNKIRISYFLNLDASESYPQEMLDGDDNLAANGVLITRGIFEVSSNMTLSWTPARHRHVGNIGLADGTVEQTTQSSLQNAATYSFLGTPFFTNRFAVP